MKYTYYGHACFLLETSKVNLLFDPFISGNPLAKGVNIQAIKADYILLSHAHGDHVADVVEIATNTGATIICMPEIASWLRKQGVDKIHEMNIGKYSFDFGSVRMVTATHSSSLPDGSYGGNPAGFVIDADGMQIYYAGDTGLTVEMKLIAELYQLEYAIMPIGGNYTMDASDAAIAANYVNCKKIIGVHYNSFPVIAMDEYTAKEIFKRTQKQLILPQIGETIDLN